MTSFHNRLIGLLSATALTCAIAPLAAGAQVPSYAQPGGETISGVITSINGKYNISVRDNRGYIDNVSLHDGTIINPRGLTLAPGESVTIAGVPQGRTFVANEIDTPYVAYPYGYPHPADVGVGLRVGGPGFGFGFRGGI